MADKFRSLPGGPGFYAALVLCLAVAGVGGYFLLMDRTPESAVQEEPSVQEEAAAPVTDLPAQLPETETEPESEPEGEEAEEQPVSMPETEVAVQAPVTAEEPLTVVSPLEGDVVAAFSMDQLLYNPTLEDWRTHDGVDIAAAEGSSVLAASAGTVVAVDDDVLMGTTVVIEHSGGYHTLYANLQSPPVVKAGDTVSAGQLIGTVGTSAAAEAAQGPHLHFSVTLDGEPVDPASFLKKKSLRKTCAGAQIPPSYSLPMDVRRPAKRGKVCFGPAPFCRSLPHIGIYLIGGADGFLTS